MWYDLLMLAIVAFTTIRGAARGMAWQLAAIAALVLCFLFATPLSIVVAPAIHLEPPLNRWIAMLAIYLVFSFGCFAFARMLRGWLEAAKFEEYDRHLGALFGLLKGATICLVISFFTVCLSEQSREYVLETQSGRLAGQVFDRLALVMPRELDELLAPYLRRFDEPAVVAANRPTDDAATGTDPFADDREGSHDVFRGSRSGAAPPEQQADNIFNEAVGTIEEKVKSGVKSLVRDALQTPSGIPERHAEQESDEPIVDRSAPRPRQLSHDSAETLRTLTAAVCGLLTDSSRKQAERRAEIEALLQGIPVPVAIAALRDWQADLLGIAADPDPETDAVSSLDRRLLRQLRAAGTALDELPRPLRARLVEAERD